MIQVQKLPTAPAILRNRGQRTTDEYKAAYNEDPVSYQQGGKKFEFDSSLYGAKSVKKALKKAQHSKCCFCEAKIDHVAYGDIEHFRPKKGFRQKATDALGRPGYYWLAYHWPNLYYSCQICNQRYKRNLCPLVDPAKRAVDHNDDLAEEYALFVDPGMPGPENHISFRQEVTFPVNGSSSIVKYFQPPVWIGILQTEWLF